MFLCLICIELYKANSSINFGSVNKTLKCDIQIQSRIAICWLCELSSSAFQTCFRVKSVLTFESLDEIVEYQHSVLSIE